MPSPVRILVTNTKSRAHREASVLAEKGYDVVITGPVESVVARTFEGELESQGAWRAPFAQMWVAFCFNKTDDDVIDIDDQD